MKVVRFQFCLKLLRERDELITKKNRKHRIILSGNGREEADEYGTAESHVEICDQLEFEIEL